MASGFIGAKLGLPYAEPLTFLFSRMFGAVVLLGAIVFVARPKWPTREGMLDSCATGVFMHALYLGGVLHFDRKWSSGCAIGAYSRTTAFAHLDHRQSPARRAGGRVVYSSVLLASI
jgi:drug/metabolite transporter (DMT)-like permease